MLTKISGSFSIRCRRTSSVDNFELMCYLDKGDLIIMKAVDQDGNEIADEEINKVFVLNTVLEKRDSD